MQGDIEYLVLACRWRNFVNSIIFRTCTEPQAQIHTNEQAMNVIQLCSTMAEIGLLDGTRAGAPRKDSISCTGKFKSTDFLRLPYVFWMALNSRHGLQGGSETTSPVSRCRSTFDMARQRVGGLNL
jgi:hypothetical protein